MQHPSGHRYQTLDHWRGIACLSVVYAHAIPWHSSSGAIGVGIFFTISGYCITAAVKSNRDRSEGIWNFAKRRLVRIYPPYWCALVIVALLSFATRSYLNQPLENYGQFSSSTQVIGNVTLTEGWRPLLIGPPANWLIGPAWSLGLEEQFYAVCGITLLFPWRTYLPIVAMLCLVCLPLSVLHERDVINISGCFLNQFWLGFATGIFLFFSIHGARHERILSFLGIIAAISFSIATHFSSPGLSSSAVFAAAALLLHRWDRSMNASTMFLMRFLKWSGTISYSLYLTHDMWGQLFMRLASQFEISSGTFRNSMVVIATYVASLAFAWPFHLYCERPFIPKSRDKRSNTPVSGTAMELKT